eukprot:353527_1
MATTRQTKGGLKSIHSGWASIRVDSRESEDLNHHLPIMAMMESICQLRLDKWIIGYYDGYFVPNKQSIGDFVADRLIDRQTCKHPTHYKFIIIMHIQISKTKHNDVLHQPWEIRKAIYGEVAAHLRVEYPICFT